MAVLNIKILFVLLSNLLKVEDCNFYVVDSKNPPIIVKLNTSNFGLDDTLKVSITNLSLKKCVYTIGLEYFDKGNWQEVDSDLSSTTIGAERIFELKDINKFKFLIKSVSEDLPNARGSFRIKIYWDITTKRLAKASLKPNHKQKCLFSESFLIKY